MFKFCEPAGMSSDILLLDGAYKEPFLIKEFEYRSLCFALGGRTQSEMQLMIRTHCSMNTPERNGLSGISTTPC
jgi:hypothetical protein